MFRWIRSLFSPIGVGTVFVYDEMAKLGEDELYRSMSEMMKRREWKHFEEFLRRRKEASMHDLVASPDPKTDDRLRGRIKAFEYIIGLSRNSTL